MWRSPHIPYLLALISVQHIKKSLLTVNLLIVIHANFMSLNFDEILAKFSKPLTKCYNQPITSFILWLIKSSHRGSDLYLCCFKMMTESQGEETLRVATCLLEV